MIPAGLVEAYPDIRADVRDRGAGMFGDDSVDICIGPSRAGTYAGTDDLG
jgi:hypothetical protein